jgi:hypothetical protein
MKIFFDLNLHVSTLKKIDIWMSCHPDSVHPYDNERFLDIIREADKNDDLDMLLNLDLYRVVKTFYPLWIEDYVYEFVQEKKKRIVREVEKRKRRKSKFEYTT